VLRWLQFVTLASATFKTIYSRAYSAVLTTCSTSIDNSPLITVILASEKRPIVAMDAFSLQFLGMSSGASFRRWLEGYTDPPLKDL